jgi:hypothetical protein
MTFPRALSPRILRIQELCSPRPESRKKLTRNLRDEDLCSPRFQPRENLNRKFGASAPAVRFGITAVLPLLLVLLFALTASSQDKKNDLQLRTVHGAVLDKDENPVPSSVVYLKNMKSQAVKTYIADETGHYRFSGLDPNVDYEIHAEHQDSMSATRTVSSFDSRRDLDVPLKLTKKKPTH